MKIDVIYNYGKNRNAMKDGYIRGMKCEALPRVGDFMQLGKQVKGKSGELIFIVEDVTFYYSTTHCSLIPFLEITQAGLQEGAEPASLHGQNTLEQSMETTKERFDRMADLLVKRGFAKSYYANDKLGIGQFDWTESGVTLLTHLRQLFDLPKVAVRDVSGDDIVAVVGLILHMKSGG